ncbi:ribonuclease HII [Candidatus Gracilibacteria bacterium]|nr:ribonuclease HII [Candidatus Gracilibacteria bacterium]
MKKISSVTGILGVDEAGRGAWAGPVVAACVLWSGKNPLKGTLRDSKKMTAKDRDKTYTEILRLAKVGKLQFGIGIISHDTIDSVGIREANRLAMREALQKMNNDEGIMKNEGVYLLIDGRDNYSFNIPGLPQPEYIVRGDSIVPQIMAASVLAKVTRDQLMIDSENMFPGYGFARHKGYGTQIHQVSLKKLGICEIHRKTYRPIILASSGKRI